MAFAKGFCCNYGSKYDKTATGFDCAIIPNPSKMTDGVTLVAGNDGFCGGKLGSASGANSKTVCCKYFS